MARSRSAPWRLTLLLLFIATAIAVPLAATLLAQEAPPKPAEPTTREKPVDEVEAPEVAAVRKTADEFQRAFNAGDARAVAALWTLGGDYTEADGETLVGREMIESAYGDFFRANPQAKIEVEIENVRVLGPNVVIEEGTSKLIRAGEADESADESSAARYSALHVRDADGWKMASVTEWPTDPTLAVSLQDVAWLVGDWEVAADGGASARVSYEWDADHAFLRGRYTLRRGEGIESRGEETIARNPAGGLRSWRFENNGAFAESLWTHQGEDWLIETAGTLPDGSEASAVVVLTPLDNDSFLWQATERSTEGVSLPGTRPLKVKRVGATNGNDRPPATKP